MKPNGNLMLPAHPSQRKFKKPMRNDANAKMMRNETI
jgi:hypothetical protein